MIFRPSSNKCKYQIKKAKALWGAGEKTAEHIIHITVFHVGTERRDFLTSKHTILELRLAFKSQL